jgi:hypothetical protein
MDGSIGEKMENYIHRGVGLKAERVHYANEQTQRQGQGEGEGEGEGEKQPQDKQRK